MAGARGADEPGYTGRIAGTYVGILTGAQIGTVTIPIPVVGTLVGAVAGGLVGKNAGLKVESGLLKAGRFVAREVGRAARSVADVVDDQVDEPVADSAPIVPPTAAAARRPRQLEAESNRALRSGIERVHSQRPEHRRRGRIRAPGTRRPARHVGFVDIEPGVCSLCILGSLLDLAMDGEGGELAVWVNGRTADYERFNAAGKATVVVRCHDGDEKTAVVSSDIWVAVRRWARRPDHNCLFVFCSNCDLYPTAVTIVGDRLDRIHDGFASEEDVHVARLLGLEVDSALLRNLRVHVRADLSGDLANYMLKPSGALGCLNR